MYWKTAIIMLLILILAPAGIEASSLADMIEVYRGDIEIIINNRQVDLEVEPFIYKDRVYVPLRFISTELGYGVEWIPSQSAVIINSPDLHIPVGECRHDLGEVFVYGEILDIDYHNYFISIEQHFDDNSIPVANPLKVISNVAIRRKNSNIHFYQLKVGDVGGFIVNKNGEVRGIVVS